MEEEENHQFNTVGNWGEENRAGWQGDDSEEMGPPNTPFLWTYWVGWIKINFIFLVFRINLLYYGTGQSGHVKGRSNLFEYDVVNQAKFGLLDVGDRKPKLQKAVMEADSDKVGL